MAWLGLSVILGEWLGPVGASRFTEEDLRCLWDGGYATLEDLEAASYVGLRDAKLKPARADQIIRAQASAAGLGVGSAAGVGAAAGVGTTRAGDAGAAAGLGVGSVAGAGSAGVGSAAQAGSLPAAAGAAAGLDLGSATGAGGRTTSAQDGEHPRGGSAGAPGAEHPRDQQEELMATIMELRSAVTDLTQMARMMPTMAQLLLAKYDYSASKASKSRQGDDFKAQLQAFYGNTMDAQHQLRCMLLDVQLPMTLVTGAHLFKHCWKDDFPVLLGLNNINDTRNGLLLFKPLEHAFNDSRICFTSVQEAGEIQFKLKLLDSGLEEVKVWDYAAEHKLHKGYDASQINGYATTVTFGELQGKSLAFANANRPFKRCLRFQGIRAMRRAEANNWLPKGGSSTQDLFCNSEEAKQLDAWLTLAAQAPPPPDADDDTSSSD